MKADYELIEEIKNVLEDWNFSKITDRKAIERIFNIIEEE